MNPNFEISEARTTIHVVTTGGTVDKSYNSSGSLINQKSIVISKLFQDIKTPHTTLTFHSLLEKDSLTLTDDDRQKIVDYISQIF